MRILITGSRDWFDIDTIAFALQNVTEGVDVTDVTVVHGGARGADHAADVSAKRLGFAVEEHPAQWDSCGSGCGPTHWRYRLNKPYCPRAGYIRNAHMVSLGADVCLAFILNESKGATMCAKLADDAGIRVHRFVHNY